MRGSLRAPTGTRRRHVAPPYRLTCRKLIYSRRKESNALFAESPAFGDAVKYGLRDDCLLTGGHTTWSSTQRLCAL